MDEVILIKDPKVIGLRTFAEMAQRTLLATIKDKLNRNLLKEGNHNWMLYTKALRIPGNLVTHVYWVGKRYDEKTDTKVQGGLFNKDFFNFAYIAVYSPKEAIVRSLTWEELIDLMYSDLSKEFKIPAINED